MAHATTRADCEALDAVDPLGAYVDRFVVADPSLVYLDGNSLGRLLPEVVTAVREAMEQEWGVGLVGSWDSWVHIAERVGDAIGVPLLGAEAGETLACDSTTVNLYKLLSAACADRPGDVVCDPGEFPTDRYVAGAVAAQHGRDVVAELPPSGTTVAVAVRSVVDYRNGAIADVVGFADAVHAAGGLVLWDCSHAVGSIPIDLRAWGADLAAGCSYKHLCGGPGAPAWLWVRRELHEQLRQPITGWWGQTDRFAMDAPWSPLPGIASWASGTPNVLGLAAVEAAAGVVASAGIDAIREKSEQLTALAQRLCDEHGLELSSPRDPARRGAHVAVRTPHAGPVVLALRARGVVPDLRPPDVIRLGLSPLSTRFTDVWDGVSALADVLATGGWRSFEGVTPEVT